MHRLAARLAAGDRAPADAVARGRDPDPLNLPRFPPLEEAWPMALPAPQQGPTGDKEAATGFHH
ncbi:hypothetical protein GCM10017776_26050 [Streptomyces griseoluteus]|nr:hypothetical protein GCM10017776_26050 [Streptomyces griseoluteus]